MRFALSLIIPFIDFWFLSLIFDIWYLIMAILLCFFYGKKQACHKAASLSRIFSFNDQFTKSFTHIFRNTAWFSYAYENFMIFFLFFCKKVLTKRKISAIIPGMGCKYSCKAKGGALREKMKKRVFIKPPFLLWKEDFLWITILVRLNLNLLRAKLRRLRIL